MSLISNSDDKYKYPRNLFRYLPVSLFYPLQQQNTIYPFVFQSLTKTYFPAVSFSATFHIAVFGCFLEGIRMERESLLPSVRGLMAVWEFTHKQKEDLSRRVAG